MLTRYPIGIAATSIALAIAGLRLAYLFRLVHSGKPAPDRLRRWGRQGRGRGDRGRRPAPAPQVDGARPGARVHVLGLHRPDPHDHRGLRRPVPEELRHPRHRPCRRRRLHRGLLRLCRAGVVVVFTRHPPARVPETKRSRLPLLRLAHDGRMDHARDDRARGHHAAAVPGGRRPTPATSPTAGGPSPPTASAGPCARSGSRPTRRSRPCSST